MEQTRSRTDADEPVRVEADGLAELRRLLVGPERSQIGKLQERLDNPALRAEDVSRILPEAIIARARRNGDLAAALSATISESIKASIKKDPQPLVDAVFPVIGPAIRRAISDALSRMVQSLNQTIEYSLSAKSWRWRLEAWRTNKPFAEVVLLHTLVYRVEQIFLIHRNTGLMLQHVKADSVMSQDADTVSGMLTAVQEFVRTSFGARENETLDELRVGQHTIWVVQGPQAVVAAVIWGTPHPDLKSKMNETCEHIHREQGAALEAFDGDAGPFEISRPSLEECLVAARHEPFSAPKKAKSPWLVLAIVGAILAVLLSLWLVPSIRQRRAFDDYVQDLQHEPGIVMISQGRAGGKYTIAGLRDPLASDPADILRRHPRLAPDQIIARWEPYESLSPQFVLTRARRALDPPPTVTLSLADGILHARGTASATWIADAQKIAPRLPGIASFDQAGLTTIDISSLINRP